MKVKEAQKIIYQELIGLKSFDEFKPNYSYFRIFKVESDFTLVYRIIINHLYDDKFDVIPGFFIINKKLNKVFSKFTENETLKKTIVNYYPIVGGDIDEISSFNHKLDTKEFQKVRYEVDFSDSSSLKDLIANLENDYHKYGSSFFRRFASLEELNILLNTYPFQEIELQFFVAYRAVYGLLIANELNDKDFDFLLEKYIEYISNFDLSDTHSELFHNCVKMFKEISDGKGS